MKKRMIITLLILLLFAGFPPLSPGQDQNQGHPPPLPPVPGDQPEQIPAYPIKLISPGVFEIGGVRIIKQEGRVEFPAIANMDKGLLEYLIVGSAGKVHESLLRTDVEPYNLQIALLMIGLEGTRNPLTEQGDPRKPDGDPISIRIQWEQAGKKKESRIEDWVVHRLDEKTIQPVKPIDWIFTGSVIWNGVFMAQVEKSIVAVYRDPVAMIDNSLPEGASDEIWFVNEKKVPPIGTKVLVVIEKEERRSK